jgi:hypothetical protein
MWALHASQVGEPLAGCGNVDQKRHVLLKCGVIMLAYIPSARDACEHDYSTFQQNVPSMVEMSREYDKWSWVRILRELMHAQSMARRASGHYMPVKLRNLWLYVGTSTREGTFC